MATAGRQTPVEKIAEQAEFAKTHLEGIADNTTRRIIDEDSWYIGMIQGRLMSLEWALRELNGGDHYAAALKEEKNDIHERLRS